MKKILGACLALITLTAFATVNPGQLIKADLINKILDLKIPTGENVYVGQITSPTVNGVAAMTSTNIANWATCNRVATGAMVCEYAAPDLQNLTESLSCQTQIRANSFTNAYMASIGNETQDSFTIRTSSGGANSDNISVLISCTRTGADFYKMKTIRQIIQDSGFIF